MQEGLSSREFTAPPFQAIDASQEAEHFEQNFDSQEYLETYYPPLDIQAAAQVLRRLAEIPATVLLDAKAIAVEFNLPIETVENICIMDFQASVTKELTRQYPEDHIRVLDVGGGPTAYQHIALSLIADNIDHAEFLEQNRKEITKWALDEPDAYNWDSYIEFVKSLYRDDAEFQELWQNAISSQVADKENLRVRLVGERRKELLNSTLEEFKLYVRQSLIGHTYQKADVFQEELGNQGNKYNYCQAITRERGAELVTSNFMVESATGDRNKWQNGLKNITDMIKDGGYIALTAIRNAEWYAVGAKRMPAVKVTGEDIRENLEALGFDIIKLQEIVGSDKESTGYDGMVFVFAKKREYIN